MLWLSHSPIVAPPELVRPDYSIYDYRNGIYKVIRFRSTAPRLCSPSERQRKGNEHKLDAAMSRARRVVLELALCNPWDWFCTFTISKDKFDRSNLIKWRDSFTQWIRDQRKKGIDIAYVIVPEQHKDGSWHAHGLFRGNMELVSFADLRAQGVRLPDDLVHGGYFNWPDYQRKFGFCSFGRIRNPVATGFYVTKYLTKDMSHHVSQVGLHLYYCSKGLERSNKHGDIYGYCRYLDDFLTNEYEFCDTGMTHVKDGLGWDFALEYMAVEPLDDAFPVEVVAQEVDSYMDAVQMAFDDLNIAGWCNGSTPGP